MGRTRALLLAVSLAALGVVGLPGAADAKLRSPHLTSQCAQGRPYEEHVFGPWRVEGCTETATPENGETMRRVYYGDVEVNGMIVEGTDAALIATVKPNGDGKNVNRIQRDNGKLVLDPKIGGSRRRMVIFSGDVDLKIETTPLNSANPRKAIACETCNEPETSGTVDIPVSGTPSLLGLRIRDRIRGATVHRGDEDSDGSIEFKPPVSLGSTASSLLRDWTAKIRLKTVDGKGMSVDSLLFKVPNIEIPGIGGFKNLSLSYSAANDEWRGTIMLDLGDALFSLDLDMTVDASTGAPTRIAGSVGNLNIPVGNTGIFLQKISALFNNNPLTMGVGADATAGPKFGSFALVEIGGDLKLQLEDPPGTPNFRLEANGHARVFPTDADSQLASGSMHVIIDADGYISIGGAAEYRLVFEPLDLGASVDIDGGGAYSSTSDVFDIEAHATGTAHLWIFGDVDVISFAATVSSNGWGFCGGLGGFLSFVAAGIGQDWDHNPIPLLGCDLTRFTAHVPDTHKATVSDGTGDFTVPQGVKKGAVELTADGPEPKLTVKGPQGNVIANTDPTGTRAIPGGAIVAPPDSSVQYVFLKNPAAGHYTVTSADGAPKLTGIRLARDAATLKGKASVARVKGHPGRRRVIVKSITGAPGDVVTIGVKTPHGIVPLGRVKSGGFTGTYDELGNGARAIVAGIERDGVPLPGRTRVIAKFKAKLPGAPHKLQAVWKGNRLSATAKEPSSVEFPNLFQYVLRVNGRPVALRRAKPGKPAKFKIDRGAKHVTVSARPVIRGRALRGKAKTVAVHRRGK